ncbi:MAG: putative rane protein [Herbinix sp.]|nr:putative rane protein [Herbinix sp.]
MKQIKLTLNHLSAVQGAVLLLIIGVIVGVICANVFQTSYYDQMVSYESDIFTGISTMKIDYFALLIYVLGNNFREYFVFWLASVTILGIPYMVYKILSFGFTTGFFVSAITMQYGYKGILIILVYAFPHGLLYLPVALFSLYKGYNLCRSMYHEYKNNVNNKLKLVKEQLPSVLLLAIVLLLGSIMEAYIGAFLLQKTLHLLH